MTVKLLWHVQTLVQIVVQDYLWEQIEFSIKFELQQRNK